MGCKDNGCWQGRQPCPTPEECVGVIRRVRSYPNVPPDEYEAYTPSSWHDRLCTAASVVLAALLVFAVFMVVVSVRQIYA